MTPLLRSNNARFEWGWVTTSSSKYLLAIVYTPINDSNVATEGRSTGGQLVWIANRNHPVDKGATVELTRNGDLELQSNREVGDLAASTVPIWSAECSFQQSGCNGVTVILNEQGNLILLNATEHVVWQSFDHPSDTLLPGQVIATGTQVAASVSFNNVSEGRFSVVMEPGGLIMYASTPDGPLPYHVVGFSLVEENNTVESVLKPICASITTMAYSSGGGVLTFQQEPSVSSVPRSCKYGHPFTIPVGSNDNNTDVFFRLDPDGNFRTYVYRLHYGWGVDQEIFSGDLYCALPRICGQYGICSSHGSCSCPDPAAADGRADLFRPRSSSDPTTGCILSRPPSCSKNATANRLIELEGVNYFANDFTHQSRSSSAECKSSCASNCNCSVAFFQEHTLNCFHYQYVMTIQNVSDRSFRAFVKVGSINDPSSTSSSENTIGYKQWTQAHSSSLSRKTVMIIIIVSVIMAVFCVTSFALLVIKIRRRLADMHADDAFLGSLPGLPTRFSLKELNKATYGFSKKLGEGGFGSVYEGILSDGSRVAVKRLEGARQGQKEFHAEVAALASINHINLVRLRGFCTQKSQSLLVYDHVTHGSLDAWLFSDSKVLEWSSRYNIALDTARGLAFLHEESREHIVHLDIKPQNILLDDNFTAKLSDFGLSKLIERGQSDVVTNMRGTPGYVAPEWLLQATITSKSDVYSYGMVLLELVSGQKNVDLSRNNFWYFPAWAVIKVEEGKMQEIVDRRLGMTEMDEKDAERIIKLAMWCIQEDPTIRPCMTTVMRILEGHAEVEAAPSLLDFAMRIQSTGKINSSSISSSHDNFNKLSFGTFSSHLSASVVSAPR
ncbi:hypothetical protein KP509_01G109100 [Ceratopteris richardii]|nr:hypothetical protein KP509_01G109100 [Ceratopteris richardii]